MAIRHFPLAGLLWLAGAMGVGLAHGEPAAFKPQQEGQARAAGVLVLPAVNKDAQNIIVYQVARAASKESWLRTYGLVVPSARDVQDINAYVSGEVRQVFVRPGDRVKAGGSLVSIYSPEYVLTQKGHLALLKNEEKLGILREEGRLPDYLKDARDNLKWWGMTDAQIKELVAKGKVFEEIMLPAPSDGLVTDVFVQPGALINAGDRSMKAFVVMGKSIARMVSTQAPYWVEGYVFADQLPGLRTGAPVRIELPGGRTIERKIAQVSPAVDPKTQRGRFMVNLQKPMPELAPGKSVNLSVRVAYRPGIWVSRDAVLAQELAPAVYVQTSPGRFERRAVSVLSENGLFVQVSGILQGEKVVTSGKMMLEGLYRMSVRSADGAGNYDHHRH